MFFIDLFTIPIRFPYFTRYSPLLRQHLMTTQKHRNVVQNTRISSHFANEIANEMAMKMAMKIPPPGIASGWGFLTR